MKYHRIIKRLFTRVMDIIASKPTIGVQTNPTQPYSLFQISKTLKWSVISCAAIASLGIFLFLGNIFSFLYTHSTLNYYKSQNIKLKQDLNTNINDLHTLLSRMDEINDMEHALRTRFGISDDEDLHNLGVGGTQNSEQLFIAQTDPLENKFLEIQGMSERLESNLKMTDEHFSLIQDYLNFHYNSWVHTPLISPTNGRVSSNYGYRTHPITGIRTRHLGIDIAGQKWTPVYAAANGRVVKSYQSQSFGHLVVVDHGNGYLTKYAHLAQRMVSQGSLVKRYDLVGYVGESGHTTGPHLHYEIHRDNNPKDPRQYMLPEGILVD